MKLTRINDDTAKHSAAHVLATAVLRIFPEAKVGIGPVTQSGFYYDFSDITPSQINKSIQKIEAECDKIQEDNLVFSHRYCSKEEAFQLLINKGQLLKAEIIKIIPEDKVSIYQLGDEFLDLCRGPHKDSSSSVGFIKILKTETVYWNNDKSRPKMVRVHCTSFAYLEDRQKYKQIGDELEENDFLRNFQQNKMFVPSESGYLYSPYGELSTNNLIKKINKIITSHTHFPAIQRPSSTSTWDSTSLDMFNSDYHTYFLKSSDKSTGLGESLSEIPNISNIYLFTDIFFTRTSFSLNANILSNIVKGLFIDKANLEIDIEGANLDDPFFKLMLQQVQTTGVSHNKVITDPKERVLLEVNVNFINSVFDQEKIASLAIRLEQKYVHIRASFNLTYIQKIHLESNKNNHTILTRFVDVLLIPMQRKHMNYCEELKRTLYNKGFFAIILPHSNSLMRNIITSDTLYPKVTGVIGNREITSGSVSTRVHRKNLGLVKNFEFFDYVDTLN